MIEIEKHVDLDHRAEGGLDRLFPLVLHELRKNVLVRKLDAARPLATEVGRHEVVDGALRDGRKLRVALEPTRVRTDDGDHHVRRAIGGRFVVDPAGPR